jgi:ankyrin repeat protein
MFSRTRVSTIPKSDSSDILYNISIDNLNELRNLITEANINNIIDSKNGYTALHYAIKLNHDKIIDFLLNMGANPTIKTYDKQDSFDLSLKYQSKFLITYEINDKKAVNTELQKTVSSLERKISNLETNNKYLVKSIDDATIKIGLLKDEVLSLKKNNTSLKNNIVKSNSDNDTLRNTKAKFENEKNILSYELKIAKDEIFTISKERDTLDSNFKSLKRKYDKLDESYSGLLEKTRKN